MEQIERELNQSLTISAKEFAKKDIVNDEQAVLAVDYRKLNPRNFWKHQKPKIAATQAPTAAPTPATTETPTAAVPDAAVPVVATIAAEVAGTTASQEASGSRDAEAPRPGPGVDSAETPAEVNITLSRGKATLFDNFVLPHGEVLEVGVVNDEGEGG